MYNILVTGSEGFVGKNLVIHLKELNKYNILEYDVHSNARELKAFLRLADIVFHLAGSNRPKDVTEFKKGNTELTEKICNYLIEAGRQISIVFSSSTQTLLDNPYGISKKNAENHLLKYSEKTGAKVAIYRLPNVFGKWSRPNYNSVVATFCYNIANDLPITIHNPDSQLTLVYVDDVVNHFISHLDKDNSSQYNEVTPSFSTTVGKLAEIIQSFKNNRDKLQITDFSDLFTRDLYAMYLSFLDKKNFSYRAPLKSDDRGYLCELFKFPRGGQVFVSTTKPGITRGNHYHHTKTEKFCVVSGSAVIRFRKIGTQEVIKYQVSGNGISIVDIPPGYTHSIENTGNDDMICLFWSSEIFNPENPDTFYEKV